MCEPCKDPQFIASYGEMACPDFWRLRAAEARHAAKTMGYPPARLLMLGIAEGYSRAAERAEDRIARFTGPPF